LKPSQMNLESQTIVPMYKDVGLMTHCDLAEFYNIKASYLKSL